MMTRPDVRFRDDQLDFLEAFVHGSPSMSPPILFIHGPNGSGKTFTINEFFLANAYLSHCCINIKDIISSKSLSQHLSYKIQKCLKDRYPNIAIQNCNPLQSEDVSLFGRFLHDLLIQYEELSYEESLYVILDGFDDLNELHLELLPQYLNLPYYMISDTMIKLRFIISTSRSSFLSNYSTYSIPTIVFPRYKTSEIQAILIQRDGFSNDPAILNKLKGLRCNNIEELAKDLFMSFVHFIIQSLANYTGNNPIVLIDIMNFKWSDFVKSLTTSNMRNTVQLYKANRELFMRPNETLEENDLSSPKMLVQTSEHSFTGTYKLSFMAKYLLIAAYLSSYLKSRYDSKVFSKKSHIRGGRSSYGRRGKLAHNPRYHSPSLFSLERMLAIFQSIYPEQVSKELSSDFIQRDTHMKANVEVYENIAELTTLRLIDTVSSSKSIDPFNEKLKYRVNIPWEIILEISESIEFDIAEYFSDTED